MAETRAAEDKREAKEDKQATEARAKAREADRKATAAEAKGPGRGTGPAAEAGFERSQEERLADLEGRVTALEAQGTRVDELVGNAPGA